VLFFQRNWLLDFYGNDPRILSLTKNEVLAKAIGKKCHQRFHNSMPVLGLFPTSAHAKNQPEVFVDNMKIL
jgi:hypothetical protein